MVLPPRALLTEDVTPCNNRQKQRFDKPGGALKVPRGLLSEKDTTWLREIYRLQHKDSFAHTSYWKRLRDPQDISFLHRAFATHPYLAARLMASVRGPLIGSAWRLLANHMDRILLASGDDEDRRLLAFAMARDGREHDALNVIDEQLRKGDALALQVLPYVALDMPEPVDDEMTDTSEPELGYRVVPMLEAYLYQQGYPSSFCKWAEHLNKGPLKYYTRQILNNLAESAIMTCV